MIISKILPQKGHIFKIYFSDGSITELDKDICLQQGLSENDHIEIEALKQLEYLSGYKRAKSRALWSLDRQDYTEKKLYEKLLQKGFQKKACAEVLARLIEIGAVNDRRYAERYAEKLLEANVSKREALQKMLVRGVPIDLAKEVLCDFAVDEEDQIYSLIEKKYAAKLQGENGYQKVFAALARKGFSFSAIKSVLKKFIEDIEFSEEY